MRYVLPPERELLDTVPPVTPVVRSSQVALVDPLHTGAGFIEAVRRRGLAVAAVYSLPPATVAGLNPDFADSADLTLQVSCAAEAAEILRALPQRTVAVVPSTEPSVAVADGLAQSLCLIGNPSSTADCRRNKIAMRDLAQRNGLRNPRYAVVEGPGEIAPAAERIGYPAVLKPPTGAGSDGVTLLRDAVGARRVAAQLRNEHDLFGRPVRAWLVEEYVRGRELAINAITTPRGHHLIDAWEYQRPDDGDYDQPYWNVVQLAEDDPARAIAWDFVRRVLDAYAVVVGPSHTEIKLSADGPVLIETASRLPGAYMTEAWAAHSFLRPFDDVLALFLGEDPFTHRPLAELRFDAHLAVCCIGNDDRPGALVDLAGLQRVEELPWVDAVHRSATPGEHVPLTTGLDTVLASVLVHAPDAATLQSRLRQVRDAVTVRIEAASSLADSGRMVA